MLSTMVIPFEGEGEAEAGGVGEVEGGASGGCGTAPPSMEQGGDAAADASASLRSSLADGSAPGSSAGPASSAAAEERQQPEAQLLPQDPAFMSCACCGRRHHLCCVREGGEGAAAEGGYREVGACSDMCAALGAWVDGKCGARVIEVRVRACVLGGHGCLAVG